MLLAKVADLLPRGLREKLFWLGVKRTLRKAGVKGDDVGNILKLLVGWRSKAAGVSSIGLGILLIGRTLAGEFSFDELTKGWAAISAGLGVIGLAGKADKNTEAVLIAGGALKAGEAETMKADAKQGLATK